MEYNLIKLKVLRLHSEICNVVTEDALPYWDCPLIAVRPVLFFWIALSSLNYHNSIRPRDRYPFYSNLNRILFVSHRSYFDLSTLPASAISELPFDFSCLLLVFSVRALRFCFCLQINFDHGSFHGPLCYHQCVKKNCLIKVLVFKRDTGSNDMYIASYVNTGNIH